MSLQSISSPKKPAAQRIRMSQVEISEKFFGAKPDFKTVNEDNRRSIQIYSLKWYGNFFDKKAIGYVNKFLKEQKYFEITDEEIRRFNANSKLFSPTYYSLIRMAADGWILSEKEISQIKNHIITIGNARFVPDEDPTIDGDQSSSIQQTIQPKNPHQILIEKINSTVLAELEGMYDTWLFAKNPTERKEVYNLNERILAHEIKGTIAMNLIQSWIESRLTELNAVKNKTDQELVEGYSTIKRINLSATINNLNELLSNISIVKTNIKNVAAVNRKPRIVREASKQKQVSLLKYKQQDTELNISSISPELVIGARTVFLFNTKYNSLTVLTSSEETGFSIKGTTILNFDSEVSFCQKLRKPSDTISFILSTSSKIKINNHLKSLTTKSGIANGRVNENVIILKVLKS